MPRRPRTSTSGLIFHVVNRAAKRAALFENAGDYDAFEHVLAEAIARGDIELYAYCLMPNHWHLLLSPRVDGALSRFMHWLTTTHARRWQTIRGLDGQGAVYQGRFRSIAVSSDEHFLWVCRYIERNALRAGLVENAEDWPRSSLARRLVEPATPWLAEWPVRRPGESAAD
jgi:putative transposase